MTRIGSLFSGIGGLELGLERAGVGRTVWLLPSLSDFGPHIEGDALSVDWSGYDLAICHPPCTFLAISGSRWFAQRLPQQEAALDFVRALMDLPVRRVAIENPVSVISSRIRKPDQIIQPWQFGHGETKTTCLWLRNLPPLTPTNVVDGREARIHRMPPTPDRGLLRSRTYDGIAEAMADQWGSLPDAYASTLFDVCRLIEHSREVES